MKIYLAGTHTKELLEKIKPPYILDSFYYIKEPNNAYCKDYILDSGLFTYLNGKKDDINWEYYADKYSDFVKSYSIKNYIELDAEKFIGLKNVEKLRDRIENRVGWQSIPVWHMNRGYEKWIEIVKSHSYICFGAFLTDGLHSSKYKNITRFLYDAKQHGTKVHGLGFVRHDWLKILKFDSVDSSSWRGRRWGHLPMFNGERIVNITVKNKRRKIDMDYHDLQEWTKYCYYAERNL